MAEWLSPSEAMDCLNNANLQGRELIRVLAWQCAWNDLRSTGFRQITIGDDHASGDERNSLGIGHLWRYFTAAFWDGSKLSSGRSTLMDVNWEHTSFKYRIEREEDDDRPPCEIACWLNWSKGSASYSILNDDGSTHLQEVWRSLQFDRLGVEALVRQWKRYGASNLLSIDDTTLWLETFVPRNMKRAWPKYFSEFGPRAITKAAFEEVAKQTWNQPRGRPKANSD